MSFSKGLQRYGVPFQYFYFIFAFVGEIKERRHARWPREGAVCGNPATRPLDITHSIPFWLLVIEINAHSTEMVHKERKYEKARKSTEHRADRAREKGLYVGNAQSQKREVCIAKENHKDVEEG